MTTALLEREEAPTTAVGDGLPAGQVDPARLRRLIELAGDLVGRSVLAVGSSRVALQARLGGAAAVAACEVHSEPEGCALLSGPFSANGSDERYDVVLVASGFERDVDPLPRIARACSAARQDILAWFPHQEPSWWPYSNRGKGLEHQPERIRALFEMAGATWCEWHPAPEGYVMHARFSDPDLEDGTVASEETDELALFASLDFF